MIADSWRRSFAAGVTPDQIAPQAYSGTDDIAQLRSAHPMKPALSLIRRLLVDDAIDSGVAVAITAADGTLLWVEGDHRTCRRAEAMNFVPGADWSESSAGTNAPGTALALDCAVQIRSCEHFARVVQPWSCTAVPIHDRNVGALIGAIDVTGPYLAPSQQVAA